jgi:hypothetical protein
MRATNYFCSRRFIAAVADALGPGHRVHPVYMGDWGASTMDDLERAGCLGLKWGLRVVGIDGSADAIHMTRQRNSQLALLYSSLSSLCPSKPVPSATQC